MMQQVVDVFEYVRQGMEDNIFNMTNDGKCSGCGSCCSRFLPLSRKEIEVIRRYIKKKHIKECKHIIPFADSLDFMCPFLDTDKDSDKCRIYSVRPYICQKFICDSEQRAKFIRKELNATRTVFDMKETFYPEEK